MKEHDLSTDNKAHRASVLAYEMAQKAKRDAAAASRAQKYAATLAVLAPMTPPASLGQILADLNLIKAYLRKLVEDGRLEP